MKKQNKKVWRTRKRENKERETKRGEIDTKQGNKKFK